MELKEISLSKKVYQKMDNEKASDFIKEVGMIPIEQIAEDIVNVLVELSEKTYKIKSEQNNIKRNHLIILCRMRGLSLNGITKEKGTGEIGIEATRRVLSKAAAILRRYKEGGVFYEKDNNPIKGIYEKYGISDPRLQDKISRGLINLIDSEKKASKPKR